MSTRIHTKHIDAPEAAVVAAALVACTLHAAGALVLDPVDYGVALGAWMTPIAMFVVRLLAAFGARAEAAVDTPDEGEES